ncbi:MAG: PAS domain S-box protein [Bacteroidetes bacterium]|nr:PAS domain S-box protein [Bacteroidota bacterium]
MIEEITILILEDVSTDFELISREIKRHIPSPLLYVSSNKDEFLKALVEVNPDIILSDYYLPTINGMDALKLSQQHDPFRPFIIVTGSINEETAVECIKGGASDYILKDWLNRLVPSIEMAYRKSQLERDAEQKNLYKAKMVDLLRCERDLGIALGLINDLPDALELIIQSLCNLDNFDYGGIYLLDPQTKILQLAVHHGVDKELLEKISVFKPDAAQNEFYRRGKPSFIFYDDVQIGHYTSVVKDVKGIARLPLNKENEPIGLIVLGSRQKKVFEDELKDILITLASLAGNLISRLQTETTLRKMFKAVEQSPAVILITDKDGHIEYTNPKFTEVTGYTKAEARGKTPRILKSGYMNPNDYKVLWDTILSGKEWKGEILNKKKDNSLFWEMANISPVFDQDGNITNFIAIKEDITRDKAIQEELVQAKTKAEESDCIKSSLLTNLSHEFRTPLTAILGFTNFLRMEVHDNHHLELLNNILVSGDNLLNTLDSILTLAQLEGEVKLNLQSADLGLLLKELCTTFEGKISTKGLKFEFQE